MIRKVTSGGTISTFAGTGTAGYTGDNGAATSATLNGPFAAIALGSTVYISDTGNNVIRKVTSGTITTAAGGGASSACTFNGTATSVSLNTPRRLAVDTTTNRLFIDDRGNDCVRALTATSISQVAATGTGSYTGDNGPAVAATISAPAALYYSNNLYIADSGNLVVRVIHNP